jgi:hypothetical protein
MKKFFTRYLTLVSRPAGLLLLTVLLLLSMYAFHGLFPFSVEKIASLSGGMGIPDARMFYNYTQLEQLFRQYGLAGREMYLKLQCVDMIYPLVYSSFLAALLFKVYKNTRLQKVAFIPFIAALCDYVENGLLHQCAVSFPHMLSWEVHIAGFVTFLKWLLIFWAFFLFLFGAVWRVAHWWRLRKR